jgi:hypothetical protein
MILQTLEKNTDQFKKNTQDRISKSPEMIKEFYKI